MTKSDGICQINGVDIGEIHIERTNVPSFGDAQVVMASAKYALVVKAGERVGAGSCTSWSDATKEKIRELVIAMEADIAAVVFGESPQPVEGVVKDTPNSDGVPGL